MKNILLLLLLFGSTTAALRAQTTCANRCLNFDGKNDYVQLPKSPVQGNINFTIEGWFRSLDNDSIPTCRTGNFERIIGCGGSRFEIGECGGQFSFYTNTSGVVNSGILTNDGKWHHFAATKDGAAFRFFLDGNLVMRYELPTGTAFSLDNTFRIGRWPGGGGTLESWPGDIDELRVWDSALPEAALWASRDCQLTGKEAGLIGYYNFDQGNAGGSNTKTKTLTDLSSSNNSGTLYGFALTGAASNWVCSGTPQVVFCGDPNKDTPMTLSPADNGRFNIEQGGLPNFTWKWNGAYPPKSYYLEVFLLEQDARKVIFSRSVEGASVSARDIWGEKPAPGIYQWQVTDLETGKQTPPAFFSLSRASCGSVIPTIVAVCKDWGQDGLPIYDVTLTLTNTPTNQALACNVDYNSFEPFPIGSGIITPGTILPVPPVTIKPGTTETFHFTFTPKNLSQTTISIKYIGKWQDKLKNSADDLAEGPLPLCLCNGCKGIENTPITVKPVAGKPGVFELSGSLITTGIPGPIDAAEFQVKSYTVTASPYYCSNGVESVETSGVFLGPASTINGSSALIFFNETISPTAAGTNNSASKDIKWLGGPLPQGTSIPFKLTVGLPPPLPGLNADCCKMKYQVCVKTSVFYDQQCKLCGNIFCVDFSN